MGWFNRVMGSCSNSKFPIPLSQIAREVGTTPAHVSKVLNGRRCRLELAEKIACAMGMSFDKWMQVYQHRPVNKSRGAA